MREMFYEFLLVFKVQGFLGKKQNKRMAVLFQIKLSEFGDWESVFH